MTMVRGQITPYYVINSLGQELNARHFDINECVTRARAKIDSIRIRRPKNQIWAK